ncbi:MAG: PEP-CTERM sorting domain-containing protein [Verrucomicrobiota bacterium]
MKPFTFHVPALCPLLAALALVATFQATAAVLLQDSFDNGIKATPDTTSIGNWTNFSDAAVTETGGLLTVTTTSSGVSNSSNFSTAVRPELNPFTSTIQFSVTDFDLAGTGDYAADSNGRFRMGLTSTLGSFFGTNDAFALEINNGGHGFRLGTKADNTSGDPGGAAASGTAFATPITAFDFIFTSTTWDLVLYSGETTLYDQSGTWSLGDAANWGTGTANTGSSSLLMAVQNTNATGTPTGFKSFSIGSIEVSATVVPEPSRALLLGLACLGLLLKRPRRPA